MTGIMVITGTRKGIGRYLAEYYVAKGGCEKGMKNGAYWSQELGDKSYPSQFRLRDTNMPRTIPIPAYGSTTTQLQRGLWHKTTTQVNNFNTKDSWCLTAAKPFTLAINAPLIEGATNLNKTRSLTGLNYAPIGNK